MSTGTICLTCRRYLEGVNRCGCPHPVPSSDGKTPDKLDLSPAARVTLGRLTGGPMLRSKFNPGVIGRLERGGMVELVMLPSDLRAHRGRKMQHARLTDMGRAVVKCL